MIVIGSSLSKGLQTETFHNRQDTCLSIHEYTLMYFQKQNLSNHSGSAKYLVHKSSSGTLNDIDARFPKMAAPVSIEIQVEIDKW